MAEHMENMIDDQIEAGLQAEEMERNHPKCCSKNMSVMESDDEAWLECEVCGKTIN